MDVDVHIASVFARGLLFASRESLPPHLAEHGPALSRVRRSLAEPASIRCRRPWPSR
jgi:D-threo-aldose 1-dehydrogenase